MREPLSIRFFREHRLVVVDPSNDHSSRALEHVQGAVMSHPRLDSGDPTLPRIIDMAQLADEVHDQTVADIDTAIAEGKEAGLQAAIATHLSAPELAGHIGRHCLQPLSDGRLHLVRLWDPHVLMHLLLWIWPADMLAKVMAPITRWSMFLNGHLITVPDVATFGRGLEKRADQHAAVLDVGIVNRVLRDVQWTFDDLPTLGPAIWRDVQHGRSQESLRDDDDLALFAGQARRWGNGFMQHEEIRAALAMTSDGETTYRDALAQMHPAAWEELQQRLDRQTQMSHG